MTTAQFIALHKACTEYSVDLTLHTARSMAHFALPQDYNEEENYLCSLTFDELDERFEFGATAEQIVVKLIDWLTDHTCERCEQVSEDDFVEVGDGEYICFGCYESMIDSADYDATLNSMRGWI